MSMIQTNVLPVGEFVNLVVHNGNYGYGIVLENPVTQKTDLYKVYCFETEKQERFYRFEMYPMVLND
jgi:hypothetical protein